MPLGRAPFKAVAMVVALNDSTLIPFNASTDGTMAGTVLLLLLVGVGYTTELDEVYLTGENGLSKRITYLRIPHGGVLRILSANNRIYKKIHTIFRNVL